jgi:AAA15 family ATPase/GTPase
MLIQFNFKNYKSFRDETTIDLSATKITEFNNRIIKVGKERILPVAAIYGANASGKSNVYSAFEFMTEYVKNSLHFGDDAQRFDENRPIPFLFDTESEIAESSFEVYFTIPNDLKEKTYNYGFCIGRDGITEEWLNSKAKTATEYARIFYRSEEELEFTGINKTGAKNIEVALDKQVLVV